MVLDSPDVPALMAFYERYFGLRLSDWLEDRMCFLRCSDDHHSLAIARRSKAGLNHVSFEMKGIDEYLRGTGRLVRAGHAPALGPVKAQRGRQRLLVLRRARRLRGRVHGPRWRGSPDEDSWVPRIWPASPEYADRWGTAGPGEDLFALSRTARRPTPACRVPTPV